MGEFIDFIHDIRGKTAKEITESALNFIRYSFNKPFFLWLHYLDTHRPYNAPHLYREKFLYDKLYNRDRVLPIEKNIHDYTGGWDAIPEIIVEDNIVNPDYYIAKYDGAISFVDEQICILEKELIESSLNKNTYIVITSDHGESLGEHHLYFNHIFFLYDVVVKVPLIIKGPMIPQNKTVDIQVRSIDILPTFLDILGIEKKHKMQGISLMPILRGRGIKSLPAFSSLGDMLQLRLNGWKLIYYGEKGYSRLSRLLNLDNQFELFDLNADPQEMHSLVRSYLDVFMSLKKEMKNYFGSKFKSSTFDYEEIEKLRSLGYIQ